MSSFNGVDLFGSGPHRFAERRQGHAALPGFDHDPPQAASGVLGAIELDVVVTGRLTAGDDGALWLLRDAVTGAVASPPASATLIDEHGHAWSGMTLLEFRPADRTDRGRRTSIGYTALFRRLAAM